MNYRHAFHAGNFADVHKHAVLCLILAHLAEKPAAFRIIDTHAGAGRYDLSGEEAMRTGEWQSGIARLAAPLVNPEAEALLAPYRAALATCGAGPGAAIYPGSPLLATALMRPQDRLIACELEPRAAAALTAALRRDKRAKPVEIDGWTALTAYIPPKERRGLVLVDPPYERPDDLTRLPQRLAAAHRKWPTGLLLAWYPIKEPAAAAQLARALVATGMPNLLRSEIMPGPAAGPGRLAGSGLIAVNPPWRLAAQLQVLGPALAEALSDGAPTPAGGRSRLEWLRQPA